MLAHRADWQGSTVVALHAFAGDRLEVALDLGEELEQAVDLHTDHHLTPAADGRLTVTLEPYGFRWFRLRRPGERLAP